MLLKSLPPELRAQVEQNIKKAGIFQEVAIEKLEEEGAPAEEIGLTSTQITSEAVLSTQTALARSLHANVQVLLDATDLVVLLKSTYYRAWWQQISSDLEAGKQIIEVVAPLRVGNQNTRKLPAKQIYRHLLT